MLTGYYYTHTASLIIIKIVKPCNLHTGIVIQCSLIVKMMTTTRHSKILLLINFLYENAFLKMRLQ